MEVVGECRPSPWRRADTPSSDALGRWPPAPRPDTGSFGDDEPSEVCARDPTSSTCSRNSHDDMRGVQPGVVASQLAQPRSVGEHLARGFFVSGVLRFSRAGLDSVDRRLDRRPSPRSVLVTEAPSWQYRTNDGTVSSLSTPYRPRYAIGVVDDIESTAVPPATQAALAALAEKAIGPELERMQKQFAETLAPILAEATTSMRDHLTAMMAPMLEEVARTSRLQETIARTAREITLHAGVLEAIESSGYRSALYALAAEHHGFLTTDMARAVGVPSVEVRKLAARGGMSNVARGLYRVEGIDGGDHAPYAEAVLRVGEDAHLVGDSVLAFHDLALVNPRRIKVGTPRRVRRDLPTHIRLVHTRTDPADLTAYDGIPSLTVAAAIRDSIGAVMPERLAEAVERATDEGLVRRREASALLAEIGSAA